MSYSRKKWARAVNLSAVLGWLLVNGVILAGVAGMTFPDFMNWMLWAAIIGLPIAFAASWLVTAPILGYAMRSSLTWPRAALWGAMITLMFGLLFLALIYFGDIGTVSGVTPLWLLAAQAILFMTGGILVALGVRLFIGPGTRT